MALQYYTLVWYFFQDFIPNCSLPTRLYKLTPNTEHLFSDVVARLNSKAQTLTYIECKINTSVGTNAIKSDMIVSGNIPENRGYIPVVIGHSSSNDCFDHIFYDGGRWLIKTNIAQSISIRFYKCIK